MQAKATNVVQCNVRKVPVGEDDLEQVGLEHLVVQQLQVVRDQVVPLQLHLVLAHLQRVTQRSFRPY